MVHLISKHSGEINMNIETIKIYCSAILIILLIGSSISGCIEKREPYSPIEYEIVVETNDKATLYIPVLLDLPNNNVADLIDPLKVHKKEFRDTEVTFDIIDTIHGKALRINTSGNVTLKAVSSSNYYKTHPEIPMSLFISETETDLKFFNMSLKSNESSHYWAYLETTKDNNVKVQITAGANVNAGGEYWTSRPDGSDERHYFFTMEPGWQLVGIRRSIIYY